jgi:hypothetical protein
VQDHVDTGDVVSGAVALLRVEVETIRVAVVPPNVAATLKEQAS